MKFTTPYTPPTLTVDAVLFQMNNNSLDVLLIRRSAAPFKGAWALPGGYNAAGQTTQQALGEVLKRKTGTILDKDVTHLEQLYTFDTIARDPRGHAVSVVYTGCGRDITHGGGSEVSAFYPVDDLPELAYDHKDIIIYARERLATKLANTNVAYSLLPPKFTLSHLQTVYEAALGKELDKRNFRKKFLSLDLIRETNETWREGAHRPAKLYEFKSQSLETLQRSFE